MMPRRGIRYLIHAEAVATYIGAPQEITLEAGEYSVFYEGMALEDDEAFRSPASANTEDETAASASASESDTENEAENDSDEPDEPDDSGGEPGFEEEEEPEPEPEPTFALKPGQGVCELRGFTRTATEFIREFDSWHEFVTSVADESLYAWKQHHSSHGLNGMIDAKWYGTPTFEDAVSMALTRGWPEGRKLLEDAMLYIPPIPTTYRALEFDIAGEFPCVPLYNASDPACMITGGGALTASKPIIQIDYGHEAHAGISAESLMLRGAAIVSLANTLELNGYSTQLRVTGNASGNSGQVFRYSIVFKRAGEHLDLDRTAFAIAHPSCLRRLGFALYEQHSDAEPFFGVGYGSLRHQPYDPASGTPGGPIFIPAPSRDETASEARAAVLSAAQHLLPQPIRNATAT